MRKLASILLILRFAKVKPELCTMHLTRVHYVEANKTLKSNLETIKIQYSENEQIDWDRLTTEMNYNDNLWSNVSNILGQRGEEIIRDFLKLPIKVF
jgi:hypothetical protein